MCFIYIFRNKTSAKRGAAIEAASREVTMTVIRLLNVVLCTMLIFATGCNRMPDPASTNDLRKAVCTLWRNDDSKIHLMGGGVFIGFWDQGKRRVFCLTARHVLTMSDGICDRFYKSNRGMYFVLEGETSTPWKHSIVPERWMTGSLLHDLAWFELSADEVEMIEQNGCNVIALGKGFQNGLCMSGEKGFLAGTTAIGLVACEQVEIGKGTEVWTQLPKWHDLSVSGTFWTNGIMDSIIGHISNMRYRMSIPAKDIGVGTSTSYITMQQIIIKVTTTNGDSGSPVFANMNQSDKVYKILVGVLSVTTNGYTCVMPLDDAIEKVCSGKGTRLVDLMEFK